MICLSWEVKPCIAKCSQHCVHRFNIRAKNKNCAILNRNMFWNGLGPKKTPHNLNGIMLNSWNNAPLMNLVKMSQADQHHFSQPADGYACCGTTRFCHITSWKQHLAASQCRENVAVISQSAGAVIYQLPENRCEQLKPAELQSAVVLWGCSCDNIL